MITDAAHLGRNTGAGKSTIIKMLIDRAQADCGIERQYATPVTGMANDAVPTSGNVHLYADPTTHSGLDPILYADSEGLNGGEKVPRAVAYREVAKSKVRGARKRLRRKQLAWAQDDSKDSRDYAVKHLYPRILYTFSDVVVFVLKEAR